MENKPPTAGWIVLGQLRRIFKRRRFDPAGAPGPGNIWFTTRSSTVSFAAMIRQ
jgi:hypothetical protein